MPEGTERVERLRRAGLRATARRVAILAALEGDDSHPGAEELHAGLAREHPSLSLSTVYATLETFIRHGLVRKLSGADGRLRVDGTLEDHDHAVCRRCGKIFDVDCEQLPLPDPPARLPRGLTVVRVRVEYDVICASCNE